MKNFSFSILLIFSIFLSHAQNYVIDYNYSVGKPYRVVDAEHKFYFSSGNEIMSVKIDKRNTTIQKFNSRTLTFIREENYKDLPKGAVIENLRSINGHYYLFYSEWDGDNEQLFYREIDFATGTYKGQPKLLIKVNGKITGTTISTGFYNFKVIDKFNFNNSFGDSKLMIQYRRKPDVVNDAKSFDVIGICVYDENLNELWKEEVEMPYTEKKMNNLDYSVDEQGNAYILAMVYDDNSTNIKKSRKGPANYHIELLRIATGTNKTSKTPVEINDRFITSISLFESGDDRMICAGFYNNGRDMNDADGIFMFRIEKDGSIDNIKYHEIPVEVLNMYTKKSAQRRNERKDDRGKAEFEELELRKLITGEDGSVTLIGEQYYIIEHTTTSSSGTTTYYTYHYNDMLVTKFNADGSLAYMKKLPKRQTGRNGRGGMSFFYDYHSETDGHYLLFLDNVKNKTLDMDDIPANHSDGSGGFLTSYKVDHPSGKVEKKYLFDTRDVKGIKAYQFTVNRIIPIGNGEFVVEVYKKKKEDILIKISVGKK